MIGLPLKRETIVLPYSGKEVEEKLWLYVLPVKGDIIPDVKDDFFLFNGWVKGGRFKISRKIKTPQNFLPLIYGEIEETSRGCLLFIRYSLFFSSNFFLIFWSVVTLFLTFFFVVFYDILFYALISLSIGVGNYLIALANFNIQVKKSKTVLYEILQGP